MVPSAWILNVVGLVAGVSGALLMFYFPPRVQLYTEMGEPHITFVGNQKAEKTGVAQWQSRLARFGPGLLVVAFLFQLAATFIAR